MSVVYFFAKLTSTFTPTSLARWSWKRKWQWKWSCPLLIGLALAGCDSASETSSGGPGKKGFSRPPTLVVAELASIRTISDRIEAVGTARANESVTLSAKVTDTVNSVRFNDGDYVAAGAVLAELTNRQDTALLAEAQANVTDAKNQLERIEGLYAKRSIPLSQVDETKARYQAMRARYDSVVARLDDRLITAPFAGLLGFRQVSEGTLITPGIPITTLDDVSVIKLDFSVPEIHLSLLQPGLTLTARSSAYPDQTFNAAVATINSRVDPVTRAAQVRAIIDNKDSLLRPGMLLNVELETAERQSLTVPESALLQRGGRVFVYLAQASSAADGSSDQKPGHRAVLREVSLGGRYAGMAEILDGLSVGDAVISEGVIKVRDNAAIRLQAAE